MSETTPDVVTLLFQHMPDADLGPGWNSTVPGALLDAAIVEIKDQRGEVQYLRWCMDRAIDLIESGRQWDAEATLRTALGNGRSATTEGA